MREFILYIDEAEYGVYEKGFTMWTQKDDAKRLDEYMFAKICTKSDKLMGFFDVSLGDEIIERAKNDEIMQEVCEFEVLIHNTFKEKFRGSFVDALKYIKANY